MSFIWPVFLVIAGCTTVDFVRKDISPQKQGILRHSPPSDAAKAEKYRAEVDKKATEFCGGKYHVTREYQAEDISNTSTGVGTGFGYGGAGILIGTSTPSRSLYNFVEFVCD